MKPKLACYTSPPTRYNNFIKNVPAFTAFKLVENKFCFILFIYLFVNLLVSFIPILFLQYDSELRWRKVFQKKVGA